MEKEMTFPRFTSLKGKIEELSMQHEKRYARATLKNMVEPLGSKRQRRNLLNSKNAKLKEAFIQDLAR